jgi:hypothetical protein
MNLGFLFLSARISGHLRHIETVWYLEERDSQALTPI